MRKWRCIKSNDKKYWTVGKIYITNDDGKGLVSDNDKDYKPNWIEPWRMREHWHLGAEFEEDLSFTQSDLKPCMFVKLRGYEEWCIIIQAKNGLHINSLKDMRCISSVENYVNFRNRTSSVVSIFDIVEVKDLNSSTSSHTTINSETLWKLEEKSPQQIKLEELELKQREIADEMAKLRKEMN